VKRVITAYILALTFGTTTLALDNESIVGIYAVDPSGGKQPDNVFLASLSKDGQIFVSGSTGKYNLEGDSLTIALPGEPSPKGKVNETKTGFLLEVNIEGQSIVQKYTRLMPVTNIAEQVHGQWTALYHSYQVKPSEPYHLMQMNIPLTFKENLLVFETTADDNLNKLKPQTFKTKISSGLCYIWFGSDNSKVSDAELAYTGGPYLALLKKDEKQKITSEKVSLKKTSKNKD
jgi:hypothetical protein